MKSRTGFKGVEISKSGKRYLSHIRYNDKNYRLGGYSTPEEAAWMYDQWAIALHGEFVSTNFEYV
ncbi:AP2 domain-containing protein [Arthrobacter sp. B2I5]|uniref:AP2 domain-containing protein n=1 Tax=Arthrobacter sp. B2I5 TaxID=3042266 RepID=UPI0027D8CD2B|nr:AP2 domain-containing protein [Arthrobacter sp. B2I5]